MLNALKKEPLPTKAGSTKNDSLTASRVARSLGDVSESGYDQRLGIKLVESQWRRGQRRRDNGSRLQPSNRAIDRIPGYREALRAKERKGR